MQDFSGPCVEHCYRCPKVTVFLSNVALIYVIACVVYIVMTRKLFRIIAVGESISTCSKIPCEIFLCIVCMNYFYISIPPRV